MLGARKRTVSGGMEQIHNIALSKGYGLRKIEYENLLFCFTIALQAITTVFCGTIRMFVSTRSLDTLFIYALLLVVFLKSFPAFHFRISAKEFGFISAFVVIWIYSFMRGGNTGAITDVLIDILETCLLTWLASRVIHVTDKFIQYLRIAAYLFIIRFLMDLFIFSRGSLENVYSQYAGYQLYIGFTMLLVPMLLQKKWYDYIAAILCAVFTLITGARGPFAFLVVSLVICMLLVSNEKRRLAKILPLIAVATVVIVINMQSIMTFFMNLVAAGGGSSRTIQTIINGNFFTYLSGRQNVYPIAWDYITKHPFVGCGFVNDRVYLAQSIGGYGSVTGNYAHNIFLEIGMQFGLVLGIVVVVFLIKLIVGTYKRQTTIEKKLFYTALLCSALLPLLVSGSYLSSPMFYALIGYSFATSIRRME